MAKMVLSEVLSEMDFDWDQKFGLPMINTENKALVDEIWRKQKDLDNVENSVSHHKERISAMTDHLTNVQQELTHIQALSRAVEKQTESELHFKALAERETGRLCQEISQLQNELISLREKKNSQENYIFKATQKMEEIKEQFNWDQQTLDAWLEESARKEDNTTAIVKYAQQDESRIRELTLSVEKLTLEATQKRKALDSQVTETIMAQAALEKMAEMVQQAHMERQELISQWECSIQQMRKKDQDRQQCAQLLAETNQEIRERKALIKEKQNFLANVVENNKDCEKKIAAVKLQANRLRQQLQEEESNRTQLQHELVNLKSRLHHTTTDLEAKRSHLASIKKDIKNKTAKLKDMQQYNIALEEKLQAVTEEVLSVEERATHMEQLHQDQEKHLKEIDAQLQQEHKLLFQKKQELEMLQAKEKNIAADISCCHAALSSLDNRLSKLDQNTLRRQEYINSQDFHIQILEEKVARLSNMEMEEKQALQKQVSKLSEELEEKKAAAALLAAQLKKLQNDVCCMRKEKKKIGAEEGALTTKTEDLNLISNVLEKDLKKLHLKKQDSIVENHILQLDVKRLRTLLYAKADGVFSLEKRKLQLQTAMKEWQEEIHVQRKMLKKQLKIAEQEIQRLRIQLHGRLSKVATMKNKYEIVAMSMAAPEGEEDDSQAYYLIKKVAQEKEELQRKGDDLDAKIRKAEKEMKALENTVCLLKNHHSTYRKSFNKVTESSPEYQEKLKLEEQKRAADDKVMFIRRQIRELQKNIKVMSSSLNNLQQEEVAQRKRNVELEARIVSLKKELISQQEKVDRATKKSFKLRKEIRAAKNTTEETFEERDIKLKELKDCKKAVKKMLLEVMEQHPDLWAILQKYFMQAGLPLPSPASSPSSRSSKSSSGHSSVSLRSSRSSGASAKSSSRSSAVPLLSVKTVELGLGLSVSSMRLPRSPGSDSSKGSKNSKISWSRHLKTL